MVPHAITVVVASLLAFIALAQASPGRAQDVPLEPYPLDDLGRQVEVTGPMRCPVVPLEPHAGEAVRWKTPLKVHPAFAARLMAFEAVVVTVAARVYGRAPSRITHLGSFNCRRIRRYPDLLSEHGLGNAVDVAGFEFPALARTDAKASPLPAALKRAFKVTVLDHWNSSAKEGTARALHSRFLHELTEALEARPDIFRVMLGPAYPGHANHFHFDCAPYRLVVL